MKLFFKTGCLLLLLLEGSRDTRAQDIHYSQYYEMPILRNPALTGMFIGDFRVAGAYRSQWSGITTPYKTSAVGVEFNVRADKDLFFHQSIGLQLTSDVAGDSKLSKTQVMPVINFHYRFNKDDEGSIVSVGIMPGVVLHSFDRSALTFDDQFVNGSVTGVSGQQFDHTSRAYLNLGLGAVYHYGGFAADVPHYYAGISATNLIPNASQEYFLSQVDLNRNIRLGINGGVDWPFTDNSRAHFYADYFRQTGNSLFQLGALYSLDFVPSDFETDFKTGMTGGVIYRAGDAFAFVVKLEYNNLQAGLSYDVNASNLIVAGKAKNVFELTLSYKGTLDLLSDVMKAIRCIPGKLLQ